MINDLTGPWDGFYASLDQCEESALAYVENLNEELVVHLETEPDIVVGQIRSLEDVLYRQNLILLTEMNAIFRKLEVELRTLRVDSLTGTRWSFMGKAMEDAYASARNEKGTGSDSRRKDVISGRLSQPELFRDIINNSKAGFDERADSFQQEINRLIDSFLEKLRDTLAIIRNDNVAEESERDPGFRERVRIAASATSAKVSGFQTVARI
ncbi:hypothetical protein K4F52_002141 [Lecanicillium sp. MT-2017a]|nr:hypothetical protein K4F52_002141 [Lecanicillium sp. MT-2017a]